LFRTFIEHLATRFQQHGHARVRGGRHEEAGSVSPRRPGAKAGSRSGSGRGIGIDNLRALEDLFGEALGDDILEAARDCIARNLPQNARLWRVEHRRLAIAVPKLGRGDFPALVTRLQIAVAQQAIDTMRGPVGVSIAAGCAVADYGQTDQALQAARLALTEAMHSGVGCIRIAEVSEDWAARRDEIFAAAQSALGAVRAGDLTVAYQPVVPSTGIRRAAFHECLVRLRGPGGSITPAGAFMPAMERLGLATLIDRQVLVHALETLATQPGIRLSVNVFPQTMQDAQWMMLFSERTGRDPTLAERLIIEVTETAAMLDPVRTLEFMNRLRRASCAFALDDFGMGHTSFGSLREFRFDIIKIDGSYITDVTTNADSRFFVSKLVEIGQHFDMATVAEFVQGPAEARILHSLGVDYFQRFYFGTPSLLLDAGPSAESMVAGAC